MAEILPKNEKTCNCRKGIIIAGGVFLAAVLAAVWILISQAQISHSWPEKWKNFSEKNYGFSIDYPAGWLLDADYDRYTSEMISAELNNKKCNGGSGRCPAECVDVRVLAGKIPETGAASGLFTQLYEDFMMVRDFPEAPLVSVLDFGAKKVFKVANDQPTLALNGRCAGPLYVFETDSGYFVYVFAGFGDKAEESVDLAKIIGSIKISGNR